MSTPTQRIARLLDEGARFMVQLPGHVAIDLTPDVIALLDTVQTTDHGCKTARNLFEPKVHGWDLCTGVHFP